MQIRKIDTRNTKDVSQFINLPFSIYKNSPLWVPQLESEMKLVMNRQRHPFYRHSDADFFLVEDNSRALGRIAVLENKNYNNFHHLKTAFFYYFECIEDVDVARLLFGAAFEWARRRGLNQITGPKGFTRSSGLGMLVDGFEYRPAIGIPYNYPYYESLVRDSGFEKWVDHYSGILHRSHQIPDTIHQIAEKVKTRSGFWIKSFKTKKELKTWIPQIEKVNAAAFSVNLGYYPSTSEEFELIANNMLQIVDPRMIKLVMKDDDVAGFVIAYPDISAGIQKARGRMFPLGWYYLLREFKRTKWVNLNGVGLLPAYQGRGANAVLYSELDKTLRETNLDYAILVQVEEGNFKSKSDMENLGVQWCITHRTFQKAL